MGRDDMREHVRKAQEAELEGDAPRAVRHLEQAAGLHLEALDWTRAAALYRHCLRLTPGRQDLQAALARVEARALEQPMLRTLAPEPDIRQALEEALEAQQSGEQEPDARQAGEQPPDTRQPGLQTSRRALDVLERGPVPAEPDLDCWCSFCCRPRAEAGPMLAGPAGAFICGGCLAAGTGLLPAPGGDPGASPTHGPAGAVEGAGGASAVPAGRPAPVDPGFIEAAVELTLKLGWSLSEIRLLTVEERTRALELVRGTRPDEALGPQPPGRRKRPAR